MYKLGNKSKERLKGVHPDLAKVIEDAIKISKVDFTVTEGLRTKERQKELVDANKSRTLNSKHLVQETGYGHAVDLVPYPTSWDIDKLCDIADAVKQSAIDNNVKIRWGGSWGTLNTSTSNCKQLLSSYAKMRKDSNLSVFIDAPHFEIVINK